MSRVRNAAWLSSAALYLAVAGCTARQPATARGDTPPAIQQAQQQARELGLEKTGNFEGRGESVDFLCFAAPRLELPDDYRGLRFRRSADGDCGFDPARWDILAYRPEAVASEQVGVTPELEAATPRRAEFVVAHEEFHDQQQIGRLPPGLHEPAATLAAFLIQAQPANDEDHPATLFRAKAMLINTYRHRAAHLYERYRRKELSEETALSQKASLFESLERDCSKLRYSQEFNRCPTVLNNAGLAFDVTYTRLYPSMYELLAAVGWDREKALGVLQTDLPEAVGIEREPRKALRALAAELRSRGQ